MKFIKSYSDFLNESFENINEQVVYNNKLKLILEKRGILDIISPELGGPVKGGRAYKAYHNAIDKLEGAGFTIVDTTSTTSQSNGNVNDSTILQHDSSPTRVTLNNYLGYTSKDNSFTYSFSTKPMTMAIKNDADYKERISNYLDLKELADVMNGIKVDSGYGWTDTVNVSKQMRDYVAAELRAIADYCAKKTSITKWVKMGPDLVNDNDFKKFLDERGCGFTGGYMGKNNIRVNAAWTGDVNPRTLCDQLGIKAITDGRVGYAYVKLDDKSDVNFMFQQLLKIPAIF